MRISFSLSILSGLQLTRSLFPLLMVCFRGEGSIGFGRSGLPLIFEGMLVPTFWMAPEAFTGEKLLCGLEDLVFEANGVPDDGLATGLVADALEDVEEIELFLLRRLPPCESWW